MTKTRSETTSKNKVSTKTIKPSNKILAQTEIIELLTFLHEANQIQFDLTKELLKRLVPNK